MYLKPMATLAPNATVSSDTLQVPSGWITSIQPAAEVITNNPTHGALYAAVILLKATAGAPTVTEFAAVLWSGYITGQQLAVSLPNIRVEEGMAIFAVFRCGSDIAATDRYRFNVQIETDSSKPPQGGGHVFNEGPTNGEGRMRFVTIPAPAAGAEYADIAVPALARWQVVGIKTKLTAAVAIANRVPFVQYFNPALANIAQFGPDHAQTALQVTDYFGGIGLSTLKAGPGNDPQFYAIPDRLYLYAGAFIRFSSGGLQPADQYAAGVLSVLEWVEGI